MLMMIWENIGNNIFGDKFKSKAELLGGIMLLCIPVFWIFQTLYK